jgi:DNA-binding transcriptional LysR family regulator
VPIAPPGSQARPADEALAAHPFIRDARQAWVGRGIETFMKRRRFSVREVMVLDTLEAIRAMVHHGLGVSIMPRRARDESGEATARWPGTPS